MRARGRRSPPWSSANGGIWGGCWYIAFPLDPLGRKGQCKPYRQTKERLVREGQAQAAMVFEGGRLVLRTGRFANFRLLPSEAQDDGNPSASTQFADYDLSQERF